MVLLKLHFDPGQHDLDDTTFGGLAVLARIGHRELFQISNYSSPAGWMHHIHLSSEVAGVQPYSVDTSNFLVNHKVFIHLAMVAVQHD